MPSVGRPIPHDSAVGHVTGTAAYIDDLPAIAGELAVDLVGAPIACGKVLSIDATEARELPGVAGIYTFADLPGKNLWGSVVDDEPFLVEQRISYLGQPMVVVAAKSGVLAAQARNLVKIQCQPSEPILTIDDAITARSWIGPQRKIERGDVDAAFQSAAHQMEGVFESGGQEQLYFESQAAIVIPDDGKSFKVHSSTQSTSEVQAEVARALGLGMHQVVCQCARIGGAFGGKET